MPLEAIEVATEVAAELATEVAAAMAKGPQAWVAGLNVMVTINFPPNFPPHPSDVAGHNPQRRKNETNHHEHKKTFHRFVPHRPSFPVAIRAGHRSEPSKKAVTFLR